LTPLAEIVARRIALEGPITVAAFMSEALAHPEHGYYMRGDPFGRAGDFITAPEISQMFGELLGLWCAQTWRRSGAPTPVHLVELGPGRGTLMADAWRALARAPDFRNAAMIHLVETSPALRARQEATLAGLEIEWHADFSNVPAGPMLLLANEFFDALPIHQLLRTPAGWRERLIGTADEQLVFTEGPGLPALAALLPETLRENASIGAVAELSPAGCSIAAAIAARIGSDGGGALIIDYGHGDSAPGDTFQAVRRHEPEDVLARPGEADLTAHVDFAALGRAAANAAAVHGPIGQGDFLRRLGIDYRAATLARGRSQAETEAIERARDRLTAPDQMGDLFKVLALGGSDAPAPPGFEP